MRRIPSRHSLQQPPGEYPTTNAPANDIIDRRNAAKAAAVQDAARASQAFAWRASIKVKDTVKLMRETIEWMERHQDSLPNPVSAAMDHLLYAADAALQPIR
jgi:hypothetical protein